MNLVAPSYYRGVFFFLTFSLPLISVFLIFSAVSPRTVLKNFICAASNLCLLLCFKIQLSLPHIKAALDVTLYYLSRVPSFVCKNS